MKKIMIIGWMDIDGFTETGKFIYRNGNLVPELIPVKKAKACVWSSSEKRFNEGKRYAEKNGYQWMILDDTKDVLNAAKSLLERTENE
jgi:hypothetical protein